MKKLRVIVASLNPVKLDCTRAGFTRVFLDNEIEVNGVSVDSGVGHQPLSQLETRTGAINRARNAKIATPQGDYWVGLEGGLEEVDVLDQNTKPTGKKEFHSVVYICIINKTDLKGEGHAAGFQIPQEIATLVKQGMELGTADDQVFKLHNSKQGDGAAGILTGGIITRKTLYEMGVILALIPFINSDLYAKT